MDITPTTYATLVRDVVEMAVKAGATEAEAVLSHGDHLSVTVRRGEVETLKEASPKTLVVRVITGHRLSASVTSDFAGRSLARFIEETVAMSRLTSPDPANELPQAAPVLPELDLQLYDRALEKLRTEDKIDLARRAEAAAFAFDPRITNTQGSGYSDGLDTIYLANSHGLFHSYRSSWTYLYTFPQAEANGQKQSAFYVTIKRFLKELKAPEKVGREAARRAAGKLGARKVPTQKAPVIFDNTVAGELWDAVFTALQGDLIHKKMSFLVGSLGQTIASPLVNLVDDGLLIRGLGSGLVDGEGVPQRCNVLIDRGVLQMYTYNTYYANKAGARSTGNAQGGGIGPTNCYLVPRAGKTLADIIRETDRGLLVMSTMGQGINEVTGDYSVGAEGYWIEKGEIAYPVHEVTIAGHMLEMMKKVDRVANDLEFWGGVSSPSFRISEMAIGGT